MWDLLLQHAGEEHQVVIVHDDDIPRLVDLEDPVRELLVHPVVIRPLDALLAPVGRLVLLVVEQGVELMLGVAPPSGLILQPDAVARGRRARRQARQGRS